MPITSDFEYQCHDNFLHDDTLNHTQKKDNVALLNEITTINNVQGFNECNTHIFSIKHNNEASLSTSHSGRYNNDAEAGKVSRHRMFRRMLGLIASVTSIVSLWKIGGSGYHKNNQLCLSIDKSLDLLNEFPIDNLENASNTLPLKLYKNDGSFNNILCDGMSLSQHEYLKEIVVIDKLSLQNINELYQSVLFIDHKRNVRSIPLPYEHHVNASEIISNIINNNDIDWRIREEFNGVYHKAKDFIDINNINEGIEKDVKLILACVSLMLQYLHENKINNLSKLSFIYGVAFTESLLSILDEMKASDLGIIDKRYKQSVMLMIRDIYASKENKSYNNSLYFHEDIINAKALGENYIYFYSALRSTVLETKNMETTTPESEKDDVKVVNLVSCQMEREDLTLVDVLRTISETIKSPLLSLVKETRIVYQYSIEDNGCPAPISPEMQGVIEMVTGCLDNLMSWNTSYNRRRLVSLIAASVISMIADSIEDKELSLDSVSEINGYILNLTKDIVSSLSTKQIKDMDSASANEEIMTMIKGLKYQNNKLTIHTENPIKTVFIDTGYNNFVDEESQKALYYDSKNFWYISRDESYTFEWQNALEKNHGYKLSGSDVVIINNSSPELYAGGTFIKINNIMKVLVKGQLYDVSEMYVRENVYRYVVFCDDVYKPLINIGGEWFFESKSTPQVSYEIINFINADEAVKSGLISKDISHFDVEPMRFSKKVQFYKKGDPYIKINDGYYLLKGGEYLSSYIEGREDILSVELKSNKYKFSYDIFGDMYNTYKKEVSLFYDVNQDEISYLDSSVIKKLIESNLVEDDVTFISDDELKSKHVVKASEIYGATSIDGIDFIVYKNNFIKIVSKHDDTFLLGDKNTVRVYKNSKSNVYYYMPDDNNDAYRLQTFKTRSSRCITKRQLFSLCSAIFFESKDITALLRRNSEHSIDFDALSEHLEPYEDTNGFYKDKHSPERIYYLSQDGGAFHVMEEKNNDDMIPVFFKIYGKNEDNSINNNVLVTDVSIVKDFDTKQAIVTTPLEAMNMVFNLNAEKNKALLKWSESQVSRKPIIADYKGLEDIQRKVNKNTDYKTVELFFLLMEKKLSLQ